MLKLFNLILILFLFNSLAFAEPVNIVVFKGQDIKAYNQAVKGFKEALQEALPDESFDFWEVKDLISDKNLSLDDIEAIKNRNPKMIFVLGSVATTIAKEAFLDIPIVFSMVLNPVASGIVVDMKSSGCNLTGASLDIPIQKQFQEIKAIFPKVKRIGVIYSFKENQELIKEAQGIASGMGFELLTEGINQGQEASAAFSKLIGKIDLLWSISDRTVFTSQFIRHSILNTLREKIPFMGLSPGYVKAGALFALSSDYEDVGRQAAETAVWIISGQRQPSDIPITTPRKIVISINLVAAEQIGMEIPLAVIQRANKIFR